MVEFIAGIIVGIVLTILFIIATNDVAKE